MWPPGEDGQRDPKTYPHPPFTPHPHPTPPQSPHHGYHTHSTTTLSPLVTNPPSGTRYVFQIKGEGQPGLKEGPVVPPPPSMAHHFACYPAVGP